MLSSVPGVRVQRLTSRSGSRLCVLSIVGLLALPNLIAGPVLLADDYVWLRNAHFGGWLRAGGPRTYSRPASLLGCDLTFGLIGPHPLALYLVQAALWALAALAVLGLMRRLLDPLLALGVCVVWLLIPNHLSLEYWLSTSQVWNAIAALCFGLSLLIDDVRRERFPWRGLCLLCLAPLFYEVTICAAFVGAIAVPWALLGRARLRIAAVGCGGLVAVAGWSLYWSSSYPGTVALWLPTDLLIRGPFSIGLNPYGLPGQTAAFLLILVILGCVATVIRRRGSLLISQKMVLSGAALIVLGVLPQLKLLTWFYGMSDRSNAVGALGTALILVGVAHVLVHHAPRLRLSGELVACALAIPLALLAVAVRADQLPIYQSEGRATTKVISALALQPTDKPIQVKGPITPGSSADNPLIYGLLDGWNATPALQLQTGSPTAVVWVMWGCVAIGPPADRPMVAYGSTRSYFLVEDCDPQPSPAA